MPAAGSSAMPANRGTVGEGLTSKREDSALKGDSGTHLVRAARRSSRLF
ncbi:hypothetical protein [Dickeya lacustris]|uniref:Uncharacterized protein n=1 Tax=Dickeya lacustris TaxID=2259638 RepID=A0ABY8GA93_9GAMM|nr:hypothetical protein [Dickeya lacustris]WFN56868.1 hypothetical protein O1Q98_06335 [Dickeya lacustris]